MSVKGYGVTPKEAMEYLDNLYEDIGYLVSIIVALSDRPGHVDIEKLLPLIKTPKIKEALTEHMKHDPT